MILPIKDWKLEYNETHPDNKLTDVTLGRILLPDQTEGSVKVTFNNMKLGKIKTVGIDFVKRACQVFKKTPNDLFRYEEWEHDETE